MFLRKRANVCQTQRGIPSLLLGDSSKQVVRMSERRVCLYANERMRARCNEISPKSYHQFLNLPSPFGMREMIHRLYAARRELNAVIN